MLCLCLCLSLSLSLCANCESELLIAAFLQRALILSELLSSLYHGDRPAIDKQNHCRDVPHTAVFSVHHGDQTCVGETKSLSGCMAAYWRQKIKISNYVYMITIMVHNYQFCLKHNCNNVMLTQISRWKQHERLIITVMILLVIGFMQRLSLIHI